MGSGCVELSLGMAKHHFFMLIGKKLHRGDYLRFCHRILIGDKNSSSYTHFCIYFSSNEKKNLGLSHWNQKPPPRLRSPIWSGWLTCPESHWLAALAAMTNATTAPTRARTFHP